MGLGRSSPAAPSKECSRPHEYGSGNGSVRVRFKDDSAPDFYRAHRFLHGACDLCIKSVWLILSPCFASFARLSVQYTSTRAKCEPHTATSLRDRSLMLHHRTTMTGPICPLLTPRFGLFGIGNQLCHYKK